MTYEAQKSAPENGHTVNAQRYPDGTTAAFLEYLIPEAERAMYWARLMGTMQDAQKRVKDNQKNPSY